MLPTLSSGARNVPPNDLLPAELCTALLAESEDNVSGVLRGSRGRLAAFFRRPINTFGLFAVGFDQMIATAAACFAVGLVGVLLIVGAKKVGLVGEAQVSQWVYAWFTLSILAFSFPLASRTLPRGDFRSKAERTISGFAEIVKVTRGNLDAVRACLERVEKVTDASTKVMWWIPGIVWAAGVYLMQRGVDRSDGNTIGAAFVAFFFAGFAAFILAAYRRGSSLVYTVAFTVLDTRGNALALREEEEADRLLRRERRNRRRHVPVERM